MRTIIEFFKVWVFWKDFIYEFREWFIVLRLLGFRSKNVTLGGDDEVWEALNKSPYTLRSNFVGTLYTVIQVSPEYDQNDSTREIFIRDQISKHIEPHLHDAGISTVLFLTTEEIDDEPTTYLLKLSTNKDVLHPWPVLGHILKLAFIVQILYFLYKILFNVSIDTGFLRDYIFFL